MLRATMFCSVVFCVRNSFTVKLPLNFALCEEEFPFPSEILHPVQNKVCVLWSYQFGNTTVLARVHVKHSFNHTEDGEKMG
jgi:hypothetical protein